MTREEIETYLPETKITKSYHLHVAWHSEKYGECSHHFWADTYQELIDKINGRLKNTDYYGENTNIKIGIVYVTTRIEISEEYKQL